MTNKLSYYIQKSKSFIQSHKEGVTSLELALYLNMHVATYDKFKKMLKDVPEVFFDDHDKKWMWTG